MVKGLYTGYTGMVNSQKRLDVISNNLANATTTGFKAEGCTTQAFDSMYAIKIKDATVGHLNQISVQSVWVQRLGKHTETGSRVRYRQRTTPMILHWQDRAFSR